MPTNAYQIIVMGGQDARLAMLKAAVAARASDLGIEPSEIVYLEEATFAGRYDRKKPAFGIYFGNQNKTVPGQLSQLEQDSIVMAPIVTSTSQVAEEIPKELGHINVVEIGLNGDNIQRLTSLIFESFRLLRKERGVFISYRR